MTEPTSAVDTDQAWLRLDKRMLLVYPVTELVKFIPVLIGSVILGTSSGNPAWSILPLTLIIGFALTRWFTTTYRVGPTDVELRTGLIQRRKLSVPRSRIRSVDIEADLLHRALGLAVLAIGTGQQAERGEKFKLDSLDSRLVPDLRATLLAYAAAGTQTVAGPEIAPESPGSAAEHPRRPGFGDAPEGGQEIGHWRASWVRYAPLSLTGVAIIAPIIGVAFQYGLGEVAFRSDALHNVEKGSGIGIALAAIALLAPIVLVVSLAACAQYLATYFGLQVHDDSKTLHLRHGLFTTRQTTLDLARLRGATVNEPLLLRLAGGAELEAIMTGENPRQKILPQAPRSAVDHTLGHLLAPRTANPPGSVALLAHGPAARRRRYARTLSPLLMLAFAMLVASLAGLEFSAWWWLVPALLFGVLVALAEDRYRGLGHAVLPPTATGQTWLITRAGSLNRGRDCLAAPGVIGWTVRQTFFQRRAGVATVVAATAAGKKRYLVVDMPIGAAWAFIEAVTPGRLGARRRA